MLKSVRLVKKKNCNKDDNVRHDREGTGLGFMMARWDNSSGIENGRWGEKHQGQVLDDGKTKTMDLKCIHDRTRWKTSKDRTQKINKLREKGTTNE